MKLRVSSRGLDMTAEQTARAEAEVQERLAKLQHPVRKAQFRLDADPAPPWCRCRVDLRFEDGRKLKITVTTSEVESVVSHALDRIEELAQRHVEVPATRPALGWLALLDA